MNPIKTTKKLSKDEREARTCSGMKGGAAINAKHSQRIGPRISSSCSTADDSEHVSIATVVRWRRLGIPQLPGQAGGHQTHMLCSIIPQTTLKLPQSTTAALQTTTLMLHTTNYCNKTTNYAVAEHNSRKKRHQLHFGFG